MARTGGSHSGARVGGGHSSGPRTGGSRTGGSHTPPPRSPRPSGSRGPAPRGPRPGGFGPHFAPPPPPRRPGPRPPRRPRRTGSCLGSLLVFIIVLVILFLVFGILSSETDPTAQTEATVSRTPLADSLCTETDYFTDEQGLISSRSQLLTGLKSFYAITGVQPYVYVTDTSELTDAYASSLYDQLFSDEGHFLLLIHNTYDSQGNENWDAYYLLGNDASQVIDDTLMDQFWQYYDSNYADMDLTAEQMLSRTFTQTASVFTTAENTQAPEPEGSPTTVILIVIIVLTLVFIGILYIILHSRKAKDSEKIQ